MSVEAIGAILGSLAVIIGGIWSLLHHIDSKKKEATEYSDVVATENKKEISDTLKIMETKMLELDKRLISMEKYRVEVNGSIKRIDEKMGNTNSILNRHTEQFDKINNVMGEMSKSIAVLAEGVKNLKENLNKE
jgi:chromosome segregation ATPase